MVERQSQGLLHVVTEGKLWNSMCQQIMSLDRDGTDRPVYRCAPPCGNHIADAEQVQSGLLWHYRGRSVDKFYGLPDEEIVDGMFAALHLAWVRDGNIYTARFH